MATGKGFHSADGLHARREEDGRITIITGYAPYDDDGFPLNPTDATTLSADQWKALHVALDPDLDDID